MTSNEGFYHSLSSNFLNPFKYSYVAILTKGIYLHFVQIAANVSSSPHSFRRHHLQPSLCMSLPQPHRKNHYAQTDDKTANDKPRLNQLLKNVYTFNKDNRHTQNRFAIAIPSLWKSYYTHTYYLTMWIVWYKKPATSIHWNLSSRWDEKKISL